MERVEVIIPVYNEGENIRAVLDALANAIPLNHRILIVHDEENDSTVPVVSELQAERPQLELIRNRFGRGVLNAIRTGFDEAEGDVVVVTMGDLSDDVAKIPRMVELIRDGGFDVVCASRYVEGGAQIGGPMLKGLLSSIAGRSLAFFTGIGTHDITNAFRAYRTSVIREIEIESSAGFEVSMEITVKAWARGYRVTEVPAVWRDRTAGESRFRIWKWLPHYLRWYIYALRQRLKTK